MYICVCVQVDNQAVSIIGANCSELVTLNLNGCKVREHIMYYVMVLPHSSEHASALSASHLHNRYVNSLGQVPSIFWHVNFFVLNTLVCFGNC